VTGALADRADEDFERERSRLVGLAYRITGSRTAAEDVVQDAWLRWHRADRNSIVRPAAWLTTVTSRLALDHLRAAGRSRETYVGPWLPEPTSVELDPSERAELAESLSLGFLTVLERLGPTERVVFLLADVFGVPFDEIALVVDRTPEACRQVASRARSRVRDGRPRFGASDEQAWQVVSAFLAAAQHGDLDSLVSLLSEDAISLSDGGARHRAARRPVVAARIPRLFVNLAARMPPGTEVELKVINGEPGVVLSLDGEPYQAIAFTVEDGLISRIWTVRNEDKLDGLGRPPVR
jgi:RNA polymerase sigma-70 factor (ECF subfamily)